MNLLPLVIAFLLMMAALSFSELSLLQKRSKTRSETVKLLDNQIARAIDKGQFEKYDKSEVEASTSWKRNEKIDATAKINLSIFMNGLERSAESDALFLITTRLIDLLYSEREFFKEAKENTPDLSEKIFTALTEKLQSLKEQGEKFDKPNQIANVKLDDPELAEIFALMLSEVPKEGAVDKNHPYYDTLLDYVAFSGGREQPIRLWLATAPFLTAIYRDGEVVSQLVKERKALYNQYSKVEKSERDAQKAVTNAQFEQLFKRELPPDMPLTLFNFEVSLTAPR